MRITYNTVAAWLDKQAANCTLDQLHHLEGLVLVAQDKAKVRDAVQQQALEKANEVAKAAGFASVEDLLRRTSPALAQQLAAQAAGGGRQLAAPRKPYLDPLDPQTQAWSLAKHHTLPAWAQRRLTEGWRLEELHYKRHAAALAARGIQPLYNAIQRHTELMAAEPPRYQRSKV